SEVRGQIEVRGVTPSPACGGGLGRGIVEGIQGIVFFILNAPFRTFPRCTGEGSNRQRFTCFEHFYSAGSPCA
ncbi:MAG: hypothetical protein ACK48E_04610, partial [Holosporales bacterium]